MELRSSFVQHTLNFERIILIKTLFRQNIALADYSSGISDVIHLMFIGIISQVRVLTTSKTHLLIKQAYNLIINIFR